MSEQIKKICENCDESSYGYGESSMYYGLRCSIKECSTDKNNTCSSFKLADHISKQAEINKLQSQIKSLTEQLGRAEECLVSVEYCYDKPIGLKTKYMIKEYFKQKREE